MGQPSGFGSHNSRTAQFLNSLEEPDLTAQLSPFVRPLPAKIAAEDVTYLSIKGALSLPPVPLQNALLQAYVEYVHPYMPLMDIHEFLSIVNRRDGLNGQTSLFLYQAVMFAATAFVDMKYLREAGYTTRKAARKSFFQKTRVCAESSRPRPPPSLSPIPAHTPPSPPLDWYGIHIHMSPRAASLRLRLRDGPPRPRPGPPAHDVLVRDP